MLQLSNVQTRLVVIFGPCLFPVLFAPPPPRDCWFSCNFWFSHPRSLFFPLLGAVCATGIMYKVTLMRCVDNGWELGSGGVFYADSKTNQLRRCFSCGVKKDEHWERCVYFAPTGTLLETLCQHRKCNRHSIL